MDGGAGDDIIRTDTFLVGTNSFDTLTGGTGTDSFELVFLDGRAEEGAIDAGTVTTITDFEPGTDILFIDSDFEPSDPPASTGGPEGLDTVTLSEAADGSFTDVIFTATTNQGTTTVTATIRLLDATRVTLDDIAFNTRG